MVVDARVFIEIKVFVEAETEDVIVNLKVEFKTKADFYFCYYF